MSAHKLDERLSAIERGRALAGPATTVDSRLPVASEGAGFLSREPAGAQQNDNSRDA